MSRGLIGFLTVAFAVAYFTACEVSENNLDGGPGSEPGQHSGVEEDIITTNPLKPELLDDPAPVPTAFDPALGYKGRYGVTENHSTDRYRFDVTVYRDATEQTEAEKLFPSHAAFLAKHGGLAIPSVQTVSTVLKQVDDTIYAGVEMAVADGLAPTLEPKRLLLAGSFDYLVAHRTAEADPALVHVAAALKLGGYDPILPADLVGAVDGTVNQFLADQALSKPIGFYTWSPALQRIWQQDRLLQERLNPENACALAGAIAADPTRRQRYTDLVALYSSMTNPLNSSLLKMLDIADSSACLGLRSSAFLSSSRTPEVALFNRLYPDGIPAGADLMGNLIQGIREGSVNLAPKPEDGWYQYQLYALETLLVTDKSEERAKVAFTARYKKRLQEAFKTMLTQHRETHVKQADQGDGGSAGPPPTPSFRLEPLATVYVRHARSYVFLEAALEKVMGPSFLDGAVAVGADGALTDSLRTRIRLARDRYYGLYLLASQDIGLAPSLDAVGDPESEQWEALAASADQWLLGLTTDALAKQDVRVIIPIAQLGDNRAKYWAVIGVRATVAGYSYIKGMDVSQPEPGDEARIRLSTEQFLEVESSAVPLNREEFRALCDAEVNAEKIQAALETR